MTLPLPRKDKSSGLLSAISSWNDINWQQYQKTASQCVQGSHPPRSSRYTLVTAPVHNPAPQCKVSSPPMPGNMHHFFTYIYLLISKGAPKESTSNDRALGLHTTKYILNKELHVYKKFYIHKWINNNNQSLHIQVCSLNTPSELSWQDFTAEYW